MIINSDITDNKLDKVIKAIQAARNNTNKYKIIFVSVSLSGIFEYLEYINSNLFSMTRFASGSIYFSAFLLLLNCIASKANLASGMVKLDYIRKNIVNDDWSYPFYNTTNINPLIMTHPVFRCIIALYLCRYGRKEEGLDIINKAALKLPCINNAIENGRIKDRDQFNNLQNIIVRDLSPDTFVKTFDMVSIITMLAALVLILIKLVTIFFMR